MGLERYVEQEGSQQSDRCKTIANYQTVQLLPLYKTFLRHNWSLRYPGLGSLPTGEITLLLRLIY